MVHHIVNTTEEHWRVDNWKRVNTLKNESLKWEQVESKSSTFEIPTSFGFWDSNKFKTWKTWFSMLITEEKLLLSRSSNWRSKSGRSGIRHATSNWMNSEQVSQCGLSWNQLVKLHTHCLSSVRSWTYQSDRLRGDRSGLLPIFSQWPLAVLQLKFPQQLKKHYPHKIPL